MNLERLTPGMRSTLIIAGLVIAATIGWIVLLPKALTDTAKYIHRRRALEAIQDERGGGVDESLIKRVTNMISYGMSRQDIREQLVTQEGATDEEVFFAYKAAEILIKDIET